MNQELLKFNEFEKFIYAEPVPSQNIVELYTLFCTLHNLFPNGINNIIEIGVYKGGMIRVWNKLLSDSGVYIGVDDNAWKLIPEVVRKYSSDKNKFVVMDSQKAVPEVSKVLNNQKADLLYIDGNHEWEYANNDYKAYKDFVSKSGVIALHDTHYVNCLGSARLWVELIHSGEYKYYVNILGDKRQWGTGLLINRE